MAKVVKRGNHLRKEVLGKYIKWYLYILSHVMVLIASAVFCYKVENIIPLVAWVIYRVAINKKLKNSIKEVQITKAGLRGEQLTENNLRRLPRQYKIISDVVIESEGKESQIDHIVVGPKGVFVVETKYWSGDIMEGSSDQKVMQVKNDKTVEHYHPSRQVGTHVYRLSTMLKKHRKNIWVKGCVFFSNSNATVIVEDEKCPLFDSPSGFLRYISTSENPDLSKEEIKEIVKIIKKEIK